ncbi:leukemia inhibitory factor [Orycteropus afer afer]|uniref:Leukemia inhibitory factor n=1 Tax=Orycteropus afer afer TaxID=1230840 RepID=A0A8B7AJF6_ORYAF|nr:leukemia inhibitory factor [Orycteropus afer afer]
MKLCCWLLGVLLLLVLHGEHGAVGLLQTTPEEASCSTDHECPDELQNLIKNELQLLNSSADALLNVYNTAQGEPFSITNEKLCNPCVKTFPPFHADGQPKDKLVELYRIIAYLSTSLSNIWQYQKSLNPYDQDLHSNLNSTVGNLQGLLNHVLCHLCKTYQVGHVDVVPVPDTSGMNTFQQKRLGCQLLAKYKQVIVELVQAF